jgi:hypothetical protein
VRNHSAIRFLAIAVGFVLVGGRSVSAQKETAPPAAVEVSCAFSNPGYTGWCRQTGAVPAGSTAAGVCAGILGCLKDVRCTKTYCDATGIRGNWKLAKIVTRTTPARTKTPGPSR